MTARTAAQPGGSSRGFLIGSLGASLLVMLLAPLVGYAVLAVATGTAWFTKQSAPIRWTLTAITAVLFIATSMGWGTGIEGPGSSGNTPGIPDPRP